MMVRFPGAFNPEQAAKIRIAVVAPESNVTCGLVPAPDNTSASSTSRSAAAVSPTAITYFGLAEAE